MRVYLGLNAFHPDSSAALVVDGELVAAICEERLGKRQKHTDQFPWNAIAAVLKQANLDYADVDGICWATAGKQSFLRRLMGTGINIRYLDVIGAIERTIQRKKLGKSESNYDIDAKFGRKVPHYHVEHHLAHIASSYFCSGFSDAAGFSFDGAGDSVSLMFAECSGTNIDVRSRKYLPHSLGFFYTALCQFIGFDRFGEEFKVMGLAPYGTPAYEKELLQVIWPDEHNWFETDQSYFNLKDAFRNRSVDERGELQLGVLYTPKLSLLLGAPRSRSEPIEEKHMDIAASIQAVFEKIGMHCLTRVAKESRTKNLVVAGGCALNGVLNAKVEASGLFERIFIHPAASDDGTAAGAALYVDSIRRGQNFTDFRSLDSAYLGCAYTEDEVKDAIDKSGDEITYEYISNIDSLCAKVADRLADGNVIGWYQGRSEWGPRALGNRSILADPSHPDMKSILNEKVKRRENFRPFAPSVLEDEMDTLFEQPLKSPFMMHVVKFRPEFADKFPAVTHVDGSARVQTVSECSNSKYFKLLLALKRKTGFGIVLNTSFNENEPVVERPEQALDCFLRTEIDFLVLGNFFISRTSGGDQLV